MIFEHVALNVPDPRPAAAWYVGNLGLKIVRSRDDGPLTRFLADENGRVVIEIYRNPTAPVPDYTKQHWLIFHRAFVSKDTDADQARLEKKAGAMLAIVEDLPDGSRLTMMRDPWGIAFQFCRRTRPMQ